MNDEIAEAALQDQAAHLSTEGAAGESRKPGEVSCVLAPWEEEAAEELGFSLAEGDNAPPEITAWVRIRRVLGKGVHPAAIKRLLELWPDARVFVSHFDDRYDGVPSRVTRVVIWSGDPDGVPVPARFISTSRCRLDEDQWTRRFGIDLAFRRALKLVSMHCKLRSDSEAEQTARGDGE